MGEAMPSMGEACQVYRSHTDISLWTQTTEQENLKLTI